MKESDKIFQVKTVGKIQERDLHALVCINDNGENLQQVIIRLKEKYDDFKVIS